MHKNSLYQEEDALLLRLQCVHKILVEDLKRKVNQLEDCDILYSDVRFDLVINLKDPIFICYVMLFGYVLHSNLHGMADDY